MKSNIGHTEAASGAAAVIKAVLILQKGTIPMQANFDNLNPKTRNLRPDQIEIPMRTKGWSGKVVFVNNYGAAGSNAALIVCKAPEDQAQREQHSELPACLSKYPIRLSAHSVSNFSAYCAALRNVLVQMDEVGDESGDLAGTAFALAHRFNPSHTISITTSVSSIHELDTMLLEQNETKSTQLVIEWSKQPTVLCFGGQTEAWIGLTCIPEYFGLQDTSRPLRTYLSIARSNRVLPEYFLRKANREYDPVTLYGVLDSVRLRKILDRLWSHGRCCYWP